jgi:hypothetical protein
MEDNGLSKINITLFILTFLFLSAVPGFSGSSFDTPITDAPNQTLFGFFDLRDRETVIQITNVDMDPAGHNVHIQIFDVSNNCNENNFFDSFTPNDTHVYNLRDIKTNDGNPSGVVLPDSAYGIFVAYGAADPNQVLIGNLRILDNNGYEYRTNLQGTDMNGEVAPPLEDFGTFNFSIKGGVTLSDIVTIVVDTNDDDQEATLGELEWVSVDVNIYDLDENAFSCRKVIFACINEDSPRYEELLEDVANDTGDDNSDAGGSVANIEWGINNAIPHSKGGELLCPGNTISEGFVRLQQLEKGNGANDEVVIYVGLNSGNGRGSMDAFFTHNTEIPDPNPPPPPP